MVYLSRIRLNPLRTEGRKLLESPQMMHGAVMGGIVGPESAGRVLWRLDAEDARRPILFVLSPARPDWTHLTERAGWPNAEGEHAAVRDYRPILSQIVTGREFAFRVTVNPVKSTKTPDTRNTQAGKATKLKSSRTRQRTASDQLEWFLKRANRWGFEIPSSRTEPEAPGISDILEPNEAQDVRIVSRSRERFLKRGLSDPVTLHVAKIEGRLRVVDPATLSNSLLYGLGPAKSYGCGLLTLAPLLRKA